MKRQALFLIISVILLLFANLGFWLSKTIYNPENFSNLVVDTYEQPDVRNAIAAEIVDKTLQDRPLAKQILSNPVQSAIAGILGSDVFKSVLEKVATRFQNYLTTDNRQDVTIEVGQVATFIKAAGSAVSPDLGAQIPDVTPQTITLVKADSLPNINKWLKPIMTIGPIAGLISIGILIYLFYVSEDRIGLMKKASAYFLIGLFALALLIPYVRTIVEGNAKNQNAQVIAIATYDSFASVLSNQILTLAVIFIAIYLVGYFLAFRKNKVTEE